MNWNNVNLKRNYERHQNIIDPLNFDTLLLEISCNIKDINAQTIKQQFEIDLQNRINSAREILEANLENILKESIEYQKID